MVIGKVCYIATHQGKKLDVCLCTLGIEKCAKVKKFNPSGFQSKPVAAEVLHTNF